MTQPGGAERIRVDQAVVLTVIIPVIYAALRLMVFARGDANRLRALVSNLDIKAVILGTVLPLGATFLWWAFFFAVLNAIMKAKAAKSADEPVKTEKREDAKRSQSTALAIFLIGFVAVWWAMPMRHMVINLFILAGLLLAALGRKRKTGLISLLSTLTAAVMLFAFIIVPLVVVFSGDAWLPRERLRLADGSTPEVYMLSSDPDWTKYLDMDRNPHIIASSNVIDRQADVTPNSRWNRTLADITGIG
ncbi:hypothetical protein [Mycobacterium sp. AZCC_0083]|uniref:hypothetical protein n=1 Tax=Mycobacterium sp. AZCC_0083 TaxID=2735882 RepID=UPI0016127484|nr:hypothetical protein [Mycobacterium sp. AZCC_0083]MBB5163691.1 hypothetical protein [Mycobacterium sp. AZCC_0083]